MIILRTENDVGEAVATQETAARIRDIKAAMQEERYRQSVTTEGGTGFHKIRKILSHDFRLIGSSLEPSLEPSLEFGFEGENRFFVEITIPSTYRELDTT